MEKHTLQGCYNNIEQCEVMSLTAYLVSPKGFARLFFNLRCVSVCLCVCVFVCVSAAVSPITS